MAPVVAIFCSKSIHAANDSFKHVSQFFYWIHSAIQIFWEIMHIFDKLYKSTSKAMDLVFEMLIHSAQIAHSAKVLIIHIYTLEHSKFT